MTLNRSLKRAKSLPNGVVPISFIDKASDNWAQTIQWVQTFESRLSEITQEAFDRTYAVRSNDIERIVSILKERKEKVNE